MLSTEPEALLSVAGVVPLPALLVVLVGVFEHLSAGFDVVAQRSHA